MNIHRAFVLLYLNSMFVFLFHVVRHFKSSGRGFYLGFFVYSNNCNSAAKIDIKCIANCTTFDSIN